MVMIARSTRILVALLLLGTALGCFRGEKQLLFHAGAGQRGALDKIKLLFEQAHPEVTVNFAYKGAGYFIADLTRSRRGDLYLPGEEFYLLQAVERGFIDDYDVVRDNAAFFVTVIITPAGNPANIRSIADCARPGVRVGLGNPKAAAIGLWHEKTFTRAGLWNEVQANAVLSAKCIPELGNAAQHGAIDAAIVWATTALLYLRDVEIIPIEPRFRGVVNLPLAVLNTSSHPLEANQLKEFILSERGRAVFLEHAYAVDVGDIDEDGFCLSGEGTDELMRWLVAAAAAAKDESVAVCSDTVGPLVGEVLRQRATK